MWWCYLGMCGGYICYGDVFELVQVNDDCLVILVFGDEFMLCYLVLLFVVCGYWWFYVLFIDGWVKDVDLYICGLEIVGLFFFYGMLGYFVEMLVEVCVL